MLRLITSRAQKASLQSQILARRRTATALPQRQSMLSYTSVVGRSFHSSATRSASSVTDEEFRKRVRESTELTSLFLKLIQKLEANPNLRLRDNKPGYFRGFQVFRILWLLLDTEVMRASYAFAFAIDKAGIKLSSKQMGRLLGEYLNYSEGKSKEK